MKSNKEITQERLKEVLEYNPETGIFIWIAKTSPASRIKVGEVAGNLQPNGRWYIMIDGKTRLAHRLAWLYMRGNVPSGEQPFIDHIDGNPLNNIFSNLRPCSNSENQRNTRKPRRNTSGFKGVSYHKLTGKFCAYVTNPLTCKKQHLGLYTTPEEASLAHIIKSVEYYRDFHPDKLCNIPPYPPTQFSKENPENCE